MKRIQCNIWRMFNVKVSYKKLYISNFEVPDILPNSMEQSIVAHVLCKWFTDPSTCYIFIINLSIINKVFIPGRKRNAYFFAGNCYNALRVW